MVYPHEGHVDGFARKSTKEDKTEEEAQSSSEVYRIPVVSDGFFRRAPCDIS